MYDGDLCAVIDEPIMMEGVDRNAEIVIDVEDKITALKEPYDIKHRADCVIRGLRNQIGEISNMATAYHNKCSADKTVMQRYENYICLLSVINGKEIDAAKTGVRYPIPRNIQKYGRPLPYFMKYASPYYKTLKKFSYAKSNMNRLCMDLEDWERSVDRRKPNGKFDWRVMLNENVGYTDEHFEQIERIYLDFCKCMNDMKMFESKCRNYEKHREDLRAQGVTKEVAAVFEVDWEYYYNIYRSKCQIVCPDIQELANIAVILCYGKYPNKTKNFIWRIAGRGVVENIRRVDVYLPQENADGEYDYLGRSYNLVRMDNSGELEEQESAVYGLLQ